MAQDIVISFPGGQQVNATMGNLVIETHQDGSAPSPFALFLAAMGTCAGIYVVSFCQQRGLPTEDIRIRQSMVSDPATHMISQVNLDIDLPADFPKKYKSAIIRAAQLCAVKRHLEYPPKFKIETHIG